MPIRQARPGPRHLIKSAGSVDSPSDRDRHRRTPGPSGTSRCDRSHASTSRSDRTETNRPGFLEIILFESRGQGRVLPLAMVRHFGLGWRPVPDRIEEPSVVEPIHPVERRELHRLQAASGAAGSNHLGLVQPDDGSASQLRRPGRYRANGRRYQPIARCRLGPSARYSGWRDIETRDPHGGPGYRESPPRGRTGPAGARRRQVGLKRVRHPPAHDAPRVGVDDQHDVNEGNYILDSTILVAENQRSRFRLLD